MSGIQHNVIVAQVKKELDEVSGGLGESMESCSPSDMGQASGAATPDNQNGEAEAAVRYVHRRESSDGGDDSMIGVSGPKRIHLASHRMRYSVEEGPTSPLTPTSPERQDSFCSSTIPGDGPLGSHELGSKDDDSPKRLCLVCGDVASGFHYGVASCEACKAFFKRTIQGNIEYTCPASGECEINKRRRKACQACRFQKCLSMGMLKEGVRLDRVRGGRQKYRRSTDSHFSSVSYLNRKQSIEENKLLRALASCEPEQLYANPDPTIPDSDMKLVSILSDLVDRELVCTIGWAKQIPGFTELSLDDQMRLLQSSWAEVIGLSLAFRSKNLTSKLQFAPDLVVDHRQARECKAEEWFVNVMRVAERLENMAVRQEEYLLLKALILVNSDVPVDDQESVKKLRETIIKALNECVSSLRPVTVAGIHVPSLLLCLPSLRLVDTTVRKFWTNIKREGRVTMQKLLVEMLESHLR
ncbi:hypothetical protein CHUAL_005040 [Chamberlinius hualienensis]